MTEQNNSDPPDECVDANDELLFAAEDDDTLPAQSDTIRPWQVLIVDDEQEVHDVTRLSLHGFRFSGRAVQFLHAYSGAEARWHMHQSKDIAVVLLDVVMESEHEGLDVVRYIRETLGNRFVRIILRTGQPGQAPEQRVIVEYDINDYKTKTELTHQKLFTTLYTSLSSYRDLIALEANRQGLRKIIDASASIFELHSMEHFAQGVLEQLTALLYLQHEAMMVRTSGIAAEHRDDNHLYVLAGTGRYAGKRGIDARLELHAVVLERIGQALHEKRSVHGQDYFVGYFKASRGHEHALYVAGDSLFSVPDLQLVELFCRNVAIAEENLVLKKDIEDTQKEIVYLLGEAIEWRSREAGNHVRRVGEYCRLLGRLYGLDSDETDLLFLAAPLHDAGKIAIPDAILNKPARHTEDEAQIMRSHAQLGYDLLSRYPRRVLQAAAIIAGSHHEKWDGSGYPKGLRGEEIPLHGRITALADVFDALGSDRCYKAAWPFERIIELIKQERGKHFEPRLVDLLLAHMDEFLVIRARLQD